MDRLRALEYFIAIAETGSFVGAADALGVPASTVSRRIQGLEDSLSARLFDRNTRVVKLTEIGTLYLEQVAPAVAALNHADETISDQPEVPAGLVRVTATPGYGGFLLMPAIEKLRHRYPDLIIDVDLTDDLMNLAAGEADIAVRATATPPDRTIAHKLEGNTYLLVASPSYLEANGTPHSARHLVDHKALLYRGPAGIVQWRLKSGDTWSEVTPRASFVSNMGHLLVAEAMRGNGIALVPAWGVADQIASGTLRKITLDEGDLFISRNVESGIYLMCHKPRYSLNKVKVTMDFLLDVLRSG